MKTLTELMSVYQQCHTRPLNRLTHYIGVPCIMFAIQVVLGWCDVGTICVAWMAAAMLLSYYYFLDPTLAAATACFLLPLTYAAEKIGLHHMNLHAALICLAVFVGGWALQFVGHAHEGTRPAFMENLFQVFISPIFLISEMMAAFGLRREPQKDMMDAN